jgi:hypothetical protein
MDKVHKPNNSDYILVLVMALKELEGRINLFQPSTAQCFKNELQVTEQFYSPIQVHLLQTEGHVLDCTNE